MRGHISFSIILLILSVAGLSFRTTEERLRYVFEKFGHLMEGEKSGYYDEHVKILYELYLSSNILLLSFFLHFYRAHVHNCAIQNSVSFSNEFV